jgi:uncharacterized RDD family membrane protein YckC
MNTDNIRYAGFWPRLGSLLLDLVVLSPLGIASHWGVRHYRLYDVYALIPLELFSLWFSVYLVSRFGGTPGKIILGLRIVRVTGEPVRFGAAFVRNLPSQTLDLLWRVGLTLTLVHMTDAEYFALDQTKHYEELGRIALPWVHWAHSAISFWVWSEFVVLLTNRKRRALHDFIAGTVVIHKPPKNALQCDSPATSAAGIPSPSARRA